METKKKGRNQVSMLAEKTFFKLVSGEDSLSKKRLFSEESGFTLIEMVIVISVIAILMSMAVPTLSGVKNRANLTVVKSDLHNIMSSLELYYMKNYKYPDSSDTSNTINKIKNEFADLNIKEDGTDYSYETDSGTDAQKYLVSYQDENSKYYYISTDEAAVVGPVDTTPSFDS